MKTNFIPIDYDYFDFNGKNYTKITGRDNKGKRICIVDTCPIYFWAILKDNVKISWKYGIGKTRLNLISVKELGQLNSPSRLIVPIKKK